MPSATCKVCSSPPHILKTINDMIRAKVKYLDIAKAVGISKSAIHRHGTRHLQKLTLNEHRERFFNPNKQRTIVLFENEPRPADLAKNVVVLRVKFEDSEPVVSRILEPEIARTMADEENAQRNKLLADTRQLDISKPSS